MLSTLAVVVDEKVIRAVVQEKEEAFGVYDDAIRCEKIQDLVERQEKKTKFSIDSYCHSRVGGANE